MQATISGVTCRVARVSDKTEWSFVEVACSDGVAGVGEASINGMGPALQAHTAGAAERLVGRKALPNIVHQVLDDSRGGLVQRTVFSAIEQALWDAQGKRLGLPVSDLLGGALRDRVPLYANINRGTTDRRPGGFAASARRACEGGFRFVKLAPFDGVGDGPAHEDAALFRAGLDRIAAVADAVAGRAEVLVDCHWRLDGARAGALLAFAAEHGLYWVECPIPEARDQLPALRRLKDRALDLGVRLAGMEKGLGPADFRPYLDEQLYDVLMPDVKHDGGLFTTRAIAEAARPAGILIAPHNPTGPICHAASVAVSATLPNLLFLEVQFEESPLFQDLVGGALAFEKGTAPVLQTPGLGVTLDPAILAEMEGM